MHPDELHVLKCLIMMYNSCVLQAVLISEDFRKEVCKQPDTRECPNLKLSVSLLTLHNGLAGQMSFMVKVIAQSPPRALTPLSHFGARANARRHWAEKVVMVLVADLRLRCMILKPKTSMVHTALLTPGRLWLTSKLMTPSFGETPARQVTSPTLKMTLKWLPIQMAHFFNLEALAMGKPRMLTKAILLVLIQMESGHGLTAKLPKQIDPQRRSTMKTNHLESIVQTPPFMPPPEPGPKGIQTHLMEPTQMPTECQ